MCGDAVLGKMVCRQGTTKTHSEVNDICAAMKVLSENDSLPMFLGTSGMVSQTPIYISDPIDGDSSEMNVRLKVIEESLDSVLKSVSLNSETLKNIHGFSKELSNTSNMNREEENINATSDVNSWSEVVSRNLKQPVTETNKGTTEKDGWITVPEKSKKSVSGKSWRERLDILRGTATCESEGESLSADVHLVAFGVKKNVTGLQLSHWLARKGLQVLSCDLLTKYEGVRSLAYKITIKSCDYEKAWNPELWPSRVGLRQHKFFDPNRQKIYEGNPSRRSEVAPSKNGHNLQIKQPDVLKTILRTNLNQIPQSDIISPSAQHLIQRQTNSQTLKPSNGYHVTPRF